MKRAFWILSALLCLPLLAGPSQAVGRGQTQGHRLIFTERTATLQEEISAAAVAGYRLLKAWPSSKGLLAILVEDEASGPPREYLVLATFRLSTLQEEMNEAAAEGYRLVPDCALRNPSLRSYDDTLEVVVVMERRAAGPRIEYRVMSSDISARDESPHQFDFGFESDSRLPRSAEPLPPFTGNVRSIQEDLSLLAAEGYQVVGLVDRSRDRENRLVDYASIRYMLIGERLVSRRNPDLGDADPKDSYRAMAATPDAGLGEALDTAAADGFRLAFGSSLDHLITLVMEKVPEPDGAYAYVVLSAYPEMYEQVQLLEGRGYRIHPQGIFEGKAHGTQGNQVSASPPVIIMEWAPGGELAYEHEVLRVINSPLTTPIRENSAMGYSMLGAASGSRAHLVVMERSAGPLDLSAEATTTSVPLDIVRLSLFISEGEMQQQLNEKGALGYEAVAVLTHDSGTSTDQEISLTFEKGEEDLYEYRVLVTGRTSTMQKELNEVSAEGYRLLPGGLAARQGPQWLAILEKRPGEPRYEYLVLDTARRSTMQREIVEAAEQGYELVGRLQLDSKLVAFLERPTSR